MNRIPFFKVESVGNDFILVERDQVNGVDLHALAMESCRRHFSVGADGLLVIWKERESEIGLRMFNPDGTEDFCGNGMRCAGVAAHYLGWSGEQMTIMHGGQRIRERVNLQDANASGLQRVAIVTTELPAADFTPSAVPVCAERELFKAPLSVAGRTLEVSAVTTGSTHTIILADELPNDEEFFTLGPAIEHHPLFPERTSVIWAVPSQPSNTPALQPSNSPTLNIRIWERGAGETQGCGTGSSAAAVVYNRARNQGGRVDVRNPGGLVKVSMEAWNAPIVTEALARIVFTGTGM